ncbi:MAG: hypothetical protein C0601_10855 [Candidatus Muiribacterium halophilum]|uniref:Four-carbon acid sugar kinase N-terminal domain-containing protein n=1 Tax=Muiribacterium halophilum TaxID=2053465 RepID=A0A2N5ZBR3_MUIH1|nr:MAG: hypothetical protein C0601_10855 [Candidatus Muirbacterium halophilum]
MLNLEKVVFISDDLTGAGDLATMLSNRSEDIFIYSTPRETRKKWLIYDTETRNLSKAETIRKLRQFKKISDKQIIIKKIDSTLRGNIKVESELFLDWFPDLTIYFIPAFPKMNRITIDGVHHIDNKKALSSEYARDCNNPPEFEMLKDYAPEGIEAFNVNLDSLKKISAKELEGHFICIDCSSEEELKDIANIISENSKKHKRTMIQGASAVNNYIEFKKERSSFRKKKIIRLQTLFFCGSLNPLNRELSKRFGMKEIIVDEDLLLGFDEYTHNLRMHINRHLIFGRNVAVFYSGQKVLYGKSDLLDDRLGKLFSQVYTLAPRVLISGGNTAVACLNNIDLYYFKLDNILGTGIASLSSNNTSFIIKPGGFGDVRLFSKIMEDQS